jgi:pilus assembly protein CpaF
MLADVGLPLAALRRQVALALDLVVQSARLHSGQRLITHVSEIGLDEATNAYRIHDLFHLDTSSGEPKLVWTGRRPTLADELGWKGLAGDVKVTKKIFAAKSGGT